MCGQGAYPAEGARGGGGAGEGEAVRSRYALRVRGVRARHGLIGADVAQLKALREPRGERLVALGGAVETDALPPPGARGAACPRGRTWSAYRGTKSALSPREASASAVARPTAASFTPARLRASRPEASSLSKYSPTPYTLVKARQCAPSQSSPAASSGRSSVSQAVKGSAPSSRSARPRAAFMRRVPVSPTRRAASGRVFAGEISSAAAGPITMTAGAGRPAAFSAMSASVPRTQSSAPRRSRRSRRRRARRGPFLRR